MSIDVVTFGCRLNTTESEVIRRHAAAAGLGDTVVVNTCAVTAEAVRQARQTIRRLRREQPERAHRRHRLRGADRSGSALPQWPKSIASLGNEEKLAAADLDVARERHRAKNRRRRHHGGARTAPHLIDGIEGRVRAFVQVQNGCDHRCTFCIIPYGRGNSRSVPIGEVVAQVRRLTENGYREVVLTGVDITSYGDDLPGAPRLGTLVKQILKHVPELERLRLSSIDSVEADTDLLDAIAEEPRLMPHLHLSLQAGDDLDPQAHEAAAPARRCHRVLRAGAAAAARHGVRRRHHRRLPDRDRRHVRALARAGR